MKRTVLIAVLLLLSINIATQAQQNNLTIGTYNIRLYVTDDEERGEIWSTR